MTGIIFYNYNQFTSRSTLRTRVFDLVEFINLAKIFSANKLGNIELEGAKKGLNEISGIIGLRDETTQFGYNSVRIIVRKGKLIRYQIEQTKGAFGKFSTTFKKKKFTNVTNYTRNIDIAGEEYLIRFCLLTNLPEESVLRKTEKIKSQYCENTQQPNMKKVAIENNYTNEDFDIHISFEHPTSEAFSAVLPYDGDNAIEKLKVIPDDRARNSKEYIGIRIYLLVENPEDETVQYFRYFDVLETGSIIINNPRNS